MAELLRALKAEPARPRASEVGRVRGIGAVAVAPPCGGGWPCWAGAPGRWPRRCPYSARASAGVTWPAPPHWRRANWPMRWPRSRAPGSCAVGGPGVVRAPPGRRRRARLAHPVRRDPTTRAGGPGAVPTGGQPARLAPHVVAGAVGAHPGAVGMLRQAARWALGPGAPEAAVRYLERAVAELGPAMTWRRC